jgi:uncharacterized damage-inducible protein DinB
MKATERAQGLTNVLTFNDDMLMTALTDITDDLARRRLRDGGPSIAWIVGHMLHHRNQIAAAIGCAGPAIDLTRFAGGATDGGGYPAVNQLQTAWAEFSGRLVPAVNALSDEGLSAPTPIALPHGEQSLLDAVRFVVWHETLHLGQLSMLRSHHGLTPLVTLVRERAAAVHG